MKYFLFDFLLLDPTFQLMENAQLIVLVIIIQMDLVVIVIASNAKEVVKKNAHLEVLIVYQQLNDIVVAHILLVHLLLVFEIKGDVSINY